MEFFMKAILLPVLLLITFAYADTNTTKEHNSTHKTVLDKKTEDAIKKEIEKEERYRREQRFYQGKEYDLKSHQVDPDAVKKVPLIEPEYDFDMDTGVYDD